MIHDEIVTYEVAKLAKEKGFNVPTDRYYHIYDDMIEAQNSLEMTSDGCADFYNSLNRFRCAAPTQSLLQRWLREEKGIYIEVYTDWEDSIEYNMIRYSWRVATIYRVGNHDIGGYYKNESEVYFDTYELALEDALKYALENLV